MVRSGRSEELAVRRGVTVGEQDAFVRVGAHGDLHVIGIQCREQLLTPVCLRVLWEHEHVEGVRQQRLYLCPHVLLRHVLHPVVVVDRVKRA
jgi:hypothetical protein